VADQIGVGEGLGNEAIRLFGFGGFDHDDSIER
jgi:hypothetical protein